MVDITEVFTLIVFLIGYPLFAATLKGGDLPGGRWFSRAYFCLVLSNIFTVVEGFLLSTLFDFLEHLSITASAILFFMAVLKFTAAKKPALPGTDFDHRARP